MWCPAKADKDDVEGLDVEAYLSAAAKLYAAARPPHEFSTEVALQLLLSHDYDVLAATHSMATAIGVDKLLEPEAPVCAATSVVRGRSGARVGLHLTLRHLATSVCEGQPQGFVRSTRSRTVHLDTQPEPCVWMVLVNGRSRIAPRDPTDRQPAAGAARPETKPREWAEYGRHNMTSGKERKITPHN